MQFDLDTNNEIDYISIEDEDFIQIERNFIFLGLTTRDLEGIFIKKHSNANIASKMETIVDF